MSRPKPKILLEITNKKNYKIQQIVESEAIWAVFFKGKPINLKTINMSLCNSTPKYKKISFSNAGHAINLAKKLNKLFECNDFHVYKLITGEIIVK